MLLFSAIRLLAHLAIGNPWWALILAALAFTDVPLVGGLAAGLMIEAMLGFRRWRDGRPHIISTWRLGWKIHRTWPREFVDTAAKTREIQSFDGSARGESRAAAIRPVVDHPRMPWRFWVRWPVITFRIGVAPGRTFRQFEQVIAPMAANMAWIHSIELEYDTDRSSFGLIHFALADVLANPDTPNWGDGNGRRFRVINNDDDQADDDGEGVA